MSDQTPNKLISELSADALNALRYVDKNIVNPAVNAAVMQPFDLVAHYVNHVSKRVSGKNVLNEHAALPVDQAATYSGTWFLQNLASGLGGLVPYTLAGEAAGKFMRAGGAALEIRGLRGAFLRSTSAHYAVGAFAYDGLRPTGKGETHLGNALGGAAGFAIFGKSNELVNSSSRLLRITGRALIGAVGADTQLVVSKGISQHKLPEWNELTKSAASGVSMNTVLPVLQQRIVRTRVDRDLTTEKGAAVDEFISTRHGSDILRKLPGLKQVLNDEPWARVKLSGNHPAFDTPARRVDLPSANGDILTLAKQLAELHAARDTRFASFFQQAAQHLKSGDFNSAWQAFHDTRAAQLTHAQNAQNTIKSQLEGTVPLDPQHLSMEIGAWPKAGSLSNEYSWRQEFTAFRKSGGTWRPGPLVRTKEVFDPAGAKSEAQSAKTVESGEAKAEENGEKLTDAERLSRFQATVATGMVFDLQKAGFIAAFAGGPVRDRVMTEAHGERTVTKDYDIATSATPDQVMSLFGEEGKGYTINQDGKEHGVIKVNTKGQTIDIATLRNDGNYTDGRRPDSVKYVPSLYEDAARRDFTINSMFWDPLTNTVYDFHGGRQDITNRIIRTVNDPNQRFGEDYFRMIRVPYFMSKLSREHPFTVDPATYKAVADHAAMITKISAERIRDGLKGILMGRDPVGGLDILMDTGLMRQPNVLPEVAETAGLKGIQSPRWHPELSTWLHKRMVIRKLAGSDEVTMWSGLLHDIGKCCTQEIHDDGRITNNDHAEVGAAMIETIADRLKMKRVLKGALMDIEANHMRMHGIDEFKLDDLYDFMEHPNFEIRKNVQHADATGTGRPDAISKSKLAWINAKQQELANHENPSQRLFAKPIVNGKLLKTMGMKQGSRVGQIIADAKSAQRQGIFIDEQSARTWLEDTFFELRPKAFIDGDKLMELGMKPGKDLGQVKNAATQAQRNGEFVDEHGAMEWLFNRYPHLRPQGGEN